MSSRRECVPCHVDAMPSNNNQNKSTGEVTLPLSSVDLASEETIWKDIKEPPSADVTTQNI